MPFERGHIKITVYDSLPPPPPPQAVVLCPSCIRSKLFAVFIETFHLCRAAVSPGDTYPAAQGAGKPVHSMTHRSP